MPDQWVSGDDLTVEAQLEHERRVARRLREAYRLAETRSTEAREELRKLRAALERLTEQREYCTSTYCWTADAVQVVLDEHAR